MYDFAELSPEQADQLKSNIPLILKLGFKNDQINYLDFLYEAYSILLAHIFKEQVSILDILNENFNIQQHSKIILKILIGIPGILENKMIVIEN